MIGHEIDARNGEQLVRFVRALGQHRYVSSRLHLVHAFAIEAACAASDDPSLAEAMTWAMTVLRDPDIDRASKDERLHRRATDAELVALLSAFWTPGDHRERAFLALAERFEEIGVVCDHHGHFVFFLKRIPQQVNRQIYVGTFFFRLVDHDS